MFLSVYTAYINSNKIKTDRQLFLFLDVFVFGKYFIFNMSTCLIALLAMLVQISDVVLASAQLVEAWLMN